MSTPTYFDTLQEAYDAYHSTAVERLKDYQFSDIDIDSIRSSTDGKRVFFSINDEEFAITESDTKRLMEYFSEIK